MGVIKSSSNCFNNLFHLRRSFRQFLLLHGQDEALGVLPLNGRVYITEKRNNCYREHGGRFLPYLIQNLR
jgi:hypothetical protein